MVRIEYTGAYEKTFRRLLEMNPSFVKILILLLNDFARTLKIPDFTLTL
jgi:hypothetical protein